MKRLLCLFVALLVSALIFVACTPDKPSNDTSSDSGVNTDSLVGDSGADSDINSDTDVSSDTDSDVNTDSDMNTDTDSDVNTDSDVSSDTDSDVNTDTDSDIGGSDSDIGDSDSDIGGSDSDVGGSDSDIGGGNTDTEQNRLTAYKSAEELAASIGATLNGDTVGGVEIMLDKNISVTFAKGSSNTEPALYNGSIRVYQKGGTVTVNAKNGCQIQLIKITYTSEKNGNGMLTVSGGSVPTVTDDTITVTSRGASSVTITVGGSSKTDRLYVGGIEVVYTSNESDDGFIYNDFTEAEKQVYNEYIGFVIPFMPNDEYHLEEYNEDGYKGVYYSALCKSKSDFDIYLEAFSVYNSNGTEVDDYGYTWHMFSNGITFIDVCYYEYEGAHYVDVDAYTPIDESGDGEGYLYYDFTEAEKKTFIDYIGLVIPFMPNDDYQTGYYDEDGYRGVYFSALCDGKSEFRWYLSMYEEYENNGVNTHENGDTWYLYSKDDVYIDICYYENDGAEDYIYVDAYIVPNGDGDVGGEEGEENEHLYYDFTKTEKETYNEYVGFVIPFLPNNDYYIESYDEDGYKGVYYSALCDDETAFTWYLAMLSSYSNDGTEVDENGDTWYLYSKGEVYIDVCYYEYEDAYYVDVDAYSGSGSDVGGDTEEEINIITNEGAGLPEDDGDGVYDVDFTVADKVKDVTDQGYYIDGCPTVGSPGVLVIPVEFSDRTALSLGYDISTIKKAFEKGGENDYFSVYDYYFKSSLGKLSLDITVVDEWFMPSNPSTYYANYTIDYEGQETLIGDQMVMDEALAYLDKTMDLSKYDSDNNGTIDAVVLVTTLKIDGNTDFYWAYRYWNIYTDSNEYYYEYDEVSANDYLWASYEFLHESLKLTGNYTHTDVINTYTFIHEFGHILGADDYYDTFYYTSPLGGHDIMDSELGDHNPYTKFNLGWISSSRLVVTDSAVTLTLEDFSKNGDTIIIANNFDPSLGVYQEYYILAYYTSSELNSGAGGYFDENGIVVYHVDASLFYEEYDGEIYYDVYNDNTDLAGGHGTVNNLIELKAHGSEYVYTEGETMKATTDNTGAALGYTFTVIELNENEATITVSAK